MSSFTSQNYAIRRTKVLDPRLARYFHKTGVSKSHLYLRFELENELRTETNSGLDTVRVPT